jgi:hypothetical protein
MRRTRLTLAFAVFTADPIPPLAKTYEAPSPKHLFVEPNAGPLNRPERGRSGFASLRVA